MFITKLGKSYVEKMRLSFSYLSLNRFSNLKDRLFNINSKTHSNVKNLYEDLRNFEMNLNYTEWVKFKKLIHESDKKLRKVKKLQLQQQKTQSHDQLKKPQSIPYQLDGSITCEYFYNKHTESIFYKSEIPYHKLGEIKPQIKQLSLEFISEQVDNYLKHDSHNYLFKIIPNAEEYQGLLKVIELRFQAVQQVVCRNIFKGYTQFSGEQQNLFFKTQQKYKGDFKFQAINPDSEKQIQIIHKFSVVAKNLACMNQCKPKIQLAVQNLLTLNWSRLPAQTLSNLLFCTAINGKDLNQITINIEEISNKILADEQSKSLSQNFFSLLAYMCIAGLQNRYVFQKADKKLFQFIKNANQFQKMTLFILISYLSQAKQVDFVKVSKNKPQLFLDYSNLESSSLHNFKKFIQQKGYKYRLISEKDKANIIAPYQIVEIQEKKFLCYSRFFYTPSQQEFTPNGLAKLINEYFNACGQKIKVINGKKLQKMQKWTQRQEYIKTKMKGLNKPIVKKQKKFDFHSPRQEYFQKKQQQKSKNP